MIMTPRLQKKHVFDASTDANEAQNFMWKKTTVEIYVYQKKKTVFTHTAVGRKYFFMLFARLHTKRKFLASIK